MDMDASAGNGDALCGLASETFSSTEETTITDDGTTTVEISVDGASSSLWWITLQTEIQHTFNADLDIVLISPAGTRVSITSDNGSGVDDVFDGTVWTDAADPVTDYVPSAGAVAAMLAPESALSALFGEDPNGTWTLEVTDDSRGDVGVLNGWSLDIVAAGEAPALARMPYTSTNATTITNGSDVTDAIDISGADGVVCDVNIETSIDHAFPADLDISVISPSGTRVVLTTDNASSTADAFDGVVWDDEANEPVTEYEFEAGLAAKLTPEGALGTFRGEDPNGTWTIEIVDDTEDEDGLLGGWSVDLATCACADL